MRRITRVVSVLLFAASVPLVTTGCVDILTGAAGAAHQASMTPEERKEYWRQWEERERIQIEKEKAAKKAKEEAAAEKAKSQPVK